MQQQKKNAESSNKHFARRNLNMNRGRPYIEYTRNQDEDFLPLPPGQHPAAAAALAQGQVQKRAVARKSTTAKRSNDLRTTKPDPNRLVLPLRIWNVIYSNSMFNRVRWESKGTVKPLDVECAEGSKFAKHQCSSLCMDDPKFNYDEEKQITKEEKLKHFNPLLIPVILGWKRQLTKHKNMGKRSIYYVHVWC